MDELKLILVDEKPKTRPTLRSFRLRNFAGLLSQLLQGGIPLLQALEILEEESDRRGEKEILARIKEEIRQGTSLSDAAGQWDNLFPFEALHLMKAGEASGALDRVLGELALNLEKKEEAMRKLREAAAYPCLILALGIVTLFILLHTVVPKLAGVYLDFEAELPAITQIILWLSEKSWMILLMLLTLAGSAVYFFANQPNVSASVLTRTPLIGRLVLNSIRFRFCSSLSLLLQSGIPIFGAFEILTSGQGPSIYRKDVEVIKDRLSQGAPPSDSFENIGWMNKTSIAMIRAGEESGRLPESLQRIAFETEKEMDAMTQMILKLIEPLLILVVGVIVGFVVVGTLLPVFDMSGLAR